MKELERKLNRWMFRINTGDRRRLWRKLSRLISNGVPIIDALTTLRDRRLTMGKNDHVAIALTAWVPELREGNRLAVAVSGWVEADEQMLIAAGEMSGKLDETLVALVGIMEANRKIKTSVFKGVFYPGVIGMIGLGVLIMFSYKVIPEFARIIPYEKWKGAPKVMIDFSGFMQMWLPYLVAGVVLMVMAFVASLPRWTEGLRIKLDKYPPYNIYRVVQGGAWMTSFAALVAAGVRVETALAQTLDNATPWLSARVSACQRGVRSGLDTATALGRSGYGFPDPEIIDDLGVYAKGGFDKALALASSEWISESVERIDGMMKIVFGVAILAVGFFIAFMVGGLIGMELQMSAILRGTYY